MTDPSVPASGRIDPAEAEADHPATPDTVSTPPQFRYVEEFVRYHMAQSLGGVRGMIESALPFVAFTIAWVVTRQLYPALGAALGVAVLLGIVRLVQRQSLRYVLTAVIPTAIAAFVATRTGRAEDVFLPGILYNGALAVLSAADRGVPPAAGRIHHRRRRGRSRPGGSPTADWSG